MLDYGVKIGRGVEIRTENVHLLLSGLEYRHGEGSPWVRWMLDSLDYRGGDERLSVRHYLRPVRPFCCAWSLARPSAGRPMPF